MCFILSIIDVLLLPIVAVSAAVLWLLRAGRLERFPTCRHLLNVIGLLPVRRHFYEPFFSKKELIRSLNIDRTLPGINLNIDKQRQWLTLLDPAEEVKRFPLFGSGKETFYYFNDFYLPGDAEYLFSMIYYLKPQKIIEIGSGFSTHLMQMAVNKIRKVNQHYSCDHYCIDPYPNSTIETLNINLIKSSVESMPLDHFKHLQENDILFIDSSHVVRPQNDVLFLFLEVLPILNSGVMIHFHDIFTPRDYLESWIIDQQRLWTEQYMLEAFLSNNHDFQVVGSLNYLKNNYFSELSRVCPVLAENPWCEPGAFWIQKKSHFNVTDKIETSK